MEKLRHNKILTSYFEDKPLYFVDSGKQMFNIRKLKELPWQLNFIEDWGRLEKLLINVDFILGSHNIKPDEYILYTLGFLNRTGKGAAGFFNRFINNPESYPTQILTIVHNILKLTGALNETKTLSDYVYSSAQKSGRPEEVVKSTLLTISSMKARGNYDYYDILTIAGDICIKLGDEARLARCMAHYADYYKYHLKDLLTGIKWHQKEESILHKTRNMESLITCLHNQAVTYGKLGDPQKQLELIQEVDKMAHELGSQDAIAGSNSDLGIFYINAARFQAMKIENMNRMNKRDTFYTNFGNAFTNMTKGWLFMNKAESGYRALGKPHSLAYVLRIQVEVIHGLIQSPRSETYEEITKVISYVGIPKAKEAYLLYLKFGEYRQKAVEYMKTLINSMSDWIEYIKANQIIGIMRSFVEILGPDQISKEEMDINLEFARFVLSHQQNVDEIKN